MICSNCGTELNDGTIYCHVCGAQQGTGKSVLSQSSRRPPNMQGNINVPPNGGYPQGNYGMPQNAPNMQGNDQMQQNGQYAQGNYQMPQNAPNIQGNYGMPQNNPQWNSQRPSGSPHTQKKSNPALIIILIFAVLLVVFLALIFFTVISGEKNPDEETSYEVVSEETEEETEEKASEAVSEEKSEEASEEAASEAAGEEKTEESTDDVNALSDAEAEELAAFLSTDEDADPDYDFRGVDEALEGGKADIEDCFEDPDAVEVHNPLLAEGGWKGYLRTEPEYLYGDDPALNYINMNIHSIDDKVKVKIHWGFFIVRGDDYYENYEDRTSEDSGKWNDDHTGFTAGQVEIKKIIYKKGENEDEEFALGEYQWESGEKSYIVLCRPNDHNIEVKESSNSGLFNSSGTGGSKKTDSNDSSGSKKSDEGSGGSKLSNADIVEKARKKAGAPSAVLDSVDPDGTLNIHLYEDMGDHTATIDWYYIDPNTLKGTNLMGDAVNLN